MPPQKHRYAVLASGRGSNLKAILDACNNKILPFKPSLLLTDNKSAKALDYAREESVETCFVDPALHRGRKAMGEAIARELKQRQIDTICLAGFMRILHSALVREFYGRIINIHPSLLPDFQGLEPQQQALNAGVAESGCTVHFVDEGVDTGPVIMQTTVRVESGDTVESLSARILEQEHKLYPKALKGLLEDRIKMADEKGAVKG